MSAEFRVYCTAIRRDHGRVCFERAIRLNQLAHDEAVAGRGRCFRMKARALSQAIRLAPEAIYVDEFTLTGGGLVGLTYPGVGRLHAKLGDLDENAHAFVWGQIIRQCSRSRNPAA